LVEAISNTMAAVKLAPLRNSDRASATAAQEHDDEAMPSPVAGLSDRGELTEPRSPGVRAPEQSPTGEPEDQRQRICHVIDPAIDNACHSQPIAPPTSRPRARCRIRRWSPAL
jgi:hypothetical protein